MANIWIKNTNFSVLKFWTQNNETSHVANWNLDSTKKEGQVCSPLHEGVGKHMVDTAHVQYACVCTQLYTHVLWLPWRNVYCFIWHSLARSLVTLKTWIQMLCGGIGSSWNKKVHAGVNTMTHDPQAHHTNLDKIAVVQLRTFSRLLMLLFGQEKSQKFNKWMGEDLKGYFWQHLHCHPN